MQKRSKFVSLRGRSAAVAILKFEAWHPVAKHGSTKQEEIPITKNRRFAASFRFLALPSKALFHSALPYFVPGWQIVPSKIAASGARALLAMTNLVGFAGKRNNFRNETFEKRCGAIPRKKRPHKAKNVRFPNKNVPILCHCEAALRPWQSLSRRYGIPWRSTGVRSKREALLQKRGFAASFRFLYLPSKVLFRSALP